MPRGAHVVPDLQVLASRIEALSAALAVKAGQEEHARTPVPRLDWDVHDVVVHLAVQAERYADFVEGVRAPEADVAGGPAGTGRRAVAEVNQALILTASAEPLPVVARRLETAGARLAEVLRNTAADAPFRSWEGDSDVRTGAATFLGELLVHGLDLARALGESWAIEPDDARAALHAVIALLPHYVDATTTASLDVRVRVRVRGGPDVVLAVRRSTAATRAWARGDDVDATVAVTPVALLLLAYRRSRLSTELLRGRVLSWGRRPLLPLQLLSWFTPP